MDAPKPMVDYVLYILDCSWQVRPYLTVVARLSAVPRLLERHAVWSGAHSRPEPPSAPCAFDDLQLGTIGPRPRWWRSSGSAAQISCRGLPSAALRRGRLDLAGILPGLKQQSPTLDLASISAVLL